MPKLKDNLFKITQTVEKDETTVSFGIELNPDHPIYQGHFPGNPITPGAAMVQIVKELIGEHLGQNIRLAEAKQIKFLELMIPGQAGDLDVELNIVNDAGKARVKAIIKDTQRTYLKLTGSFEVQS